MNKISEDFKFFLGLIISMLAIITLDVAVSWLFKAVSIISIINDFLGRYSGLLLFVLIFVYIKLFAQQRVINKKLGMLLPETINIVSDENTIFVGSSTNKILPNNVKAVPAWVHGLWKEADKKFPSLKMATWIADRRNITNEEAIQGGQYAFVREFEIPCEVNQVRSAVLCLLVDDVCELSVNQSRFGKVFSYDELHSFDIKNALVKGKNRIHFVIENSAFTELVIPSHPRFHKDFSESKEKFLWNPYGFKFIVSVQYFK